VLHRHQHDQRVHAPFLDQHLQILAGPPRLAVVEVEHDVHAARQSLVLKIADVLGEVGVADIGHHEADGIRAACFQGASGHVGPIAEFLRGLLHAADRLGAAALAAQSQ
jgi:hypothetical protein